MVSLRPTQPGIFCHSMKQVPFANTVVRTLALESRRKTGYSSGGCEQLMIYTPCVALNDAIASHVEVE